MIKKITIDKLAKIINDGFNGQMEYMEKKFTQIDSKLVQVASKEQAQNLEKRLGAVEKDVKFIKENIDEADKVGKRVDYIENILDIPAIKKN